MELHFCSQCGISIPLAEIQSGAAVGSDGRMLCAEHRASRGAAAAPAGDVELLFCANCQVSIPVSDVQGGRAKREFGSLLCAPCSVADTPERERRRKAVEAAMADDASPAVAAAAAAETPRRCAVCAAAVSPSQISSGRAFVDGDRVVCPHCRDAGAARVPLAAAAERTSGPSWGLVGLLVVACAAAGFFGAEYVKAQRAPAGPRPVGERELAALRNDVEARLREAAAAADRRVEELRTAQRDGADDAQARLAEDLAQLRADVADVRARLTTADAELAKSLARLEGQVVSLQEMTKGLAARPAAEAPRAPADPPRDVATRPPEGPPPEAPRGAPAVPAPDAEVTRLVKQMLESKEDGERFTATVELGRRKERSAIPAFAKVLVEDPNVMVRRAAARGLAEVRAWNAVPVLVQALEDKEAYVAQQANFALQTITGQDFGVTLEHSMRDRRTKANAATKWWEKNKDAPPDGVSLEPVAAR